MNKNLLIGLGVLLAVVVAGYYFIAMPKVSYAPTGNTSTAALAPGPVTEINVSAKEYAYTPATITVKSGENVKINFTNSGTVTHNLTIQGLNLATKSIGPGETDSISFVAPAAGSYTFYCSIDGHKDLGLTGTLVVQ